MLTIRLANPSYGTYEIKIGSIFLYDGFVYIRTKEYPLEKLTDIHKDIVLCSGKLIFFYFYENKKCLFRIDTSIVDIIILEDEERTILMRIKLDGALWN